MTIKELIRTKRDVTVTQFCEEAKITRQTYYNIMGDKFTPSLLTIKKICKYLKVDAKDYLD